MDKGQNVYASTSRYNYAPFWFNFLHLLYQIANKDPVNFRYLIIGALTLVDLLIFIILYKKIGSLTAFLFFLNPISIIISGYHNQFDNFAILAGMIAVLLIGNNYEEPITSRKFGGLVLLGLSLIIKHIFFMLPIWLAVKQKKVLPKILVIAVPIVIFLVSFLPYWADGKSGIIENVFSYHSHNNENFYWLFVPLSLQKLFSSTVIWILLLTIFAFIFRKRNSFDSLLYYSCVLVVASPAIVNQYLTIALPFAAANFNPFTLAFMMVSTIQLLFDKGGLDLLQRGLPLGVLLYPVLVVLLLLGLIRSDWSDSYQRFFAWILYEVKIQIGFEEKEPTSVKPKGR
jgi:hypothetical protein